MNWLVTAFEPFNQAQTNSSWTALKALQAQDWNGQVEFMQTPVPVTFAGAWPAVEATLRSTPAKAVLALGQAGGRKVLNLERVALNWVDTRTPDNALKTPAQGPLTRGDTALWSDVPWERLEDSPLWERSYSAGTYVCNALLYRLLEWSKAEGRLAGFVHVPHLESQQIPAQPYMADRLAIEGLTRILRFLTTL